MRARTCWILCAVAVTACDALASRSDGSASLDGAGGIGGQPPLPAAGAGAGGVPATGSFTAVPAAAGSSAPEPVPGTTPMADPVPIIDPTCPGGLSQRPGEGIPDFCDGMDGDCDGLVDEGLDADGDGFSACEFANERPVDCDHERADVHPGHEELCDGVDNDCDGTWDEGTDGVCPDPVCDHARQCPEGLICDWRDHRSCIELAECPDAVATDATCEPPAAMWEASECDPTSCRRWQSGTCWGTCECAPDGVYRWDIGCTE